MGTQRLIELGNAIGRAIEPKEHGFVGFLEVFIAYVDYSAKRVKELQDSADAQDRALAPLFDPANIPVWETLPIVLEQWEKDPKSPSGWSYRMHIPIIDKLGLFKLAEAYTLPAIPAMPIEAAANDLWSYQSDEFRAQFPKICVSNSVGTQCGLPPMDAMEGNLLWMPPFAVKTAHMAGLPHTIPPGKVASKPPANSVPTVTKVAVVGAGAAATWYFWPQITKFVAGLLRKL